MFKQASLKSLIKLLSKIKKFLFGKNSISVGINIQITISDNPIKVKYFMITLML